LDKTVRRAVAARKRKRKCFMKARWATQVEEFFQQCPRGCMAVTGQAPER